MKKNLQRFGASVLAAAMVAQSVALPAAAETTKIDSSVAQSVAASAASAASAVQSLPKFTSTADLIKQTAQTLAAQGEVHELEQDDAKLEATAQSKAGMSLAALENALADAMYANAAAGKINTEAYGLNKDEMASVMAAPAAHNRYSAAVPVPAATVYTVELPPVLAVYTEMLLPAGSDSGSQSAAPVVPEKPAVPDCQP